MPRHEFVPLETSMVPLKLQNVYILQILKCKQTLMPEHE